MNTFTKSIFLMLAAGSASAREASLPGALRAQIAATEKADPPNGCVRDERPQTQSKTASKTRFRWTYQGYNGECLGNDGRIFEWGKFRNIDDSNQCAEYCTNETGDDETGLNNVVMGFNYNCRSYECECLYTEATLTDDDRRWFSTTNQDTRVAKARSSVDRMNNQDDWTCFRLVGTEFTGEGLNQLREMHKTMRALNQQKKN